MPRRDADRVYDELLTRIVRGSLAPGTRVVERDVASRLGVSRTPVREAVQRLLVEGFLEANEAGSYGRPVVAALTADDARDLHDLVAALEAIAARRVAGLPDTDRARLAREMYRRNDAFAAAARAEPLDMRTVIDADHAVHGVYIEAGSGRRLLALRAAVKPQLDRYALQYRSLAARGVDDSVAEHRRIAVAIAAGDTEGAATAVLENWENARARLEAVMAAVGERGEW